MKVFIVNGSMSYSNLFEKLGYPVVSDPNEADFFCFTGGEDVNPELYGEHCGPHTSFNSRRDESDLGYFHMLGDRPAVGICRGGQFLNVMNGGSMIQHIDPQGYKHLLYDILWGNEYEVTSTHHQMMLPGVKGRVLGVNPDEYYFDSDDEECECIEIVLYDKALCFQPHPEYGDAEDTARLFEKLLDYFLNTE